MGDSHKFRGSNKQCNAYYSDSSDVHSYCIILCCDVNWFHSYVCNADCFCFGRNQENYSVLWVGTGIGAITFFGGGCIEAVLRTICRIITSGEITGEFIIGAIGYGFIVGIVEILLLIMAKSLDKQNPIKGKNKSDFIHLAKTIPSAISSLFQK